MSELNTLMRNGGKKPILIDGKTPTEIAGGAEAA